MEAVTSLTPEKLEECRAAYKKLREAVAGTTSKDWFINFDRKSGYAHYRFSGYVSEALVAMLGREPTADEIIMLVDSGFNHFGASCSIFNRRFNGSVYTD